MLSSYYTTLIALKGALSDPLLVGGVPSSGALGQDASASLRLGGAVVVYSMLEDHIDKAVDRLVDFVSARGFDARLFPEKLQKFLIVDAISSMANQMRFQESGENVASAMTNIPKLSLVTETPSEFRLHGLRKQGSNVVFKDVTGAFGAFGVKNLFEGKLKDILNDIGGSRPSPKQDFITLSKTRNSSAHKAYHSISISNLQNHIDSAILLGVAIDCLIRFMSAAIKFYNNESDFDAEMSFPAKQYRFLDEVGVGKFVESVSGAKRASKKYSTLEAGLRGCMSRASDLPIVVRRAQFPIGVAY
ncbi:MAG: hypothetical protein U9P68_07795 [Pseudomonadota bacterium]|nr:hypothetical protein [Pseudomonadota bacterium]